MESLASVDGFGPEGTVFTKALEVSIPFDASGVDASKMTALWSRLSGDGYDMVPTTLEGGGATTRTRERFIPAFERPLRAPVQSDDTLTARAPTR